MKSFKEIFNMSDETYDKLQWIFRIVLPKLLVTVGIVGEALGWAHTAIVMIIFSAVVALVGESLGIASDNYKSS